MSLETARFGEIAFRAGYACAIRFYICTWPSGKARIFTSVSAFDGYVHAVRESGYLVAFSNPQNAAVQSLVTSQ